MTLPPERPPWIRLIRLTGTQWAEAPVWWWPSGDKCWRCGQPTLMEGRMRRHGLNLRRPPLLCGSCGAVRVWPMLPDGPSLDPMEGGEWSPPDQAVAELRRLAFNRLNDGLEA